MLQSMTDWPAVTFELVLAISDTARQDTCLTSLSVSDIPQGVFCFFSWEPALWTVMSGGDEDDDVVQKKSLAFSHRNNDF